jgi:hypothetical protein
MRFYIVQYLRRSILRSSGVYNHMYRVHLGMCQPTILTTRPNPHPRKTIVATIFGIWIWISCLRSNEPCAVISGPLPPYNPQTNTSHVKAAKKLLYYGHDKSSANAFSHVKAGKNFFTMTLSNLHNQRKQKTGWHSAYNLQANASRVKAAKNFFTMNLTNLHRKRKQKTEN